MLWEYNAGDFFINTKRITFRNFIRNKTTIIISAGKPCLDKDKKILKFINFSIYDNRFSLESLLLFMN